MKRIRERTCKEKETQRQRTLGRNKFDSDRKTMKNPLRVARNELKSDRSVILKTRPGIEGSSIPWCSSWVLFMLNIWIWFR